jgi:hypothetical protein
MIIQYLMSGINPDFRKELSRRESFMNTLKEFLTYAKIEEDLHNTFENFRNLSTQSQQPHLDYNYPLNQTLTTTVNPRKQYHQNMNRNDQQTHPIRLQQSIPRRNSNISHTHTPSLLPKLSNRNPTQQDTFNRKPKFPQSTLQHQFSNCKICGRTNHRTIDCFYKQPTGCFKCGQNHIIRDCKILPNFQ